MNLGGLVANIGVSGMLEREKQHGVDIVFLFEPSLISRDTNFVQDASMAVILNTSLVDFGKLIKNWDDEEKRLHEDVEGV